MIEYPFSYKPRRSAREGWLLKVLVVVALVLALLALAIAASAQTPVTAVEDTTNRVVKYGDLFNKAIRVNVVAGGGAGGTSSSFDAAFPATGTAVGMKDSAGTNMIAFNADASGFLKVNCAAGCVAGGSFLDAAAFTFGTTPISLAGAVVDDVATNTVAENSAGAPRMTGSRVLYFDLSLTGANATAIKVDGSAVTQPVSGTFFQATQPISAAALPLPAGAATAALQTQPGVDIGDVTVNNGAGGAAVNIQDGGNTITVDGTVAVSGSVAVTGPLTDAQLRATPVPVSGTVTVTDGAGALNVIVDSGTLTTVSTVTAVTAITNALPAGNNNIGDVDVATLPAITGTVAVSSLIPSAAATSNNDGACVSVTTTSGTVLASFATRAFAAVCSRVTNTDIVYLRLAATATTSDLPLEIGQCFNLGGPRVYTGVIDSRSAAGTQSVCVVEW